MLDVAARCEVELPNVAQVLTYIRNKRAQLLLLLLKRVRAAKTRLRMLLKEVALEGLERGELLLDGTSAEGRGFGVVLLRETACARERRRLSQAVTAGNAVAQIRGRRGLRLMLETEEEGVLRINWDWQRNSLPVGTLRRRKRANRVIL